MKIAVVLIFVIFIPVVAFAAVIHVPGDYPTIQEAIDAAEVLDTVLVDPGTYVENIDFLGKDILVRSVFGPEVTVIDGNQSGSVVSFKSGESLVSLLEGFTLTNGSGTYHGSSYYAGGGIYCFNESSPMILNNIICYNETAEDYGYGGGIIAVLSAAPLIEGNLIHDNKAYYGGGICARSGSAPEISCNLIRNNESISAGAGVQCYANAPAMILNNVIRDNMALGSYGKGGGISCSSAQALICGNLIQGNQTGKGGAGIECFGDNVWIINNIIDGNISGTSGGGIYLNWSNSPVICNTIINNYAKYSGGGLYLCDHLDTFAFNNIFWDNDAGDDGTEIMVDGVKWGCSLVIGYCDVKDAIHSIWQGYISQIIYREGMIDADPLFVDF
ncbi:MAG: NosD domain-containing protein, partial [Planctomycetota bacterium]